MCDESTEKDNDRFFRSGGTLTRRQFNTLAAGAALSVMLPPVANAVEVTGMDVVVPTPDGKADCYFVHPKTGKSPAVLIWPDIVGLRPAFRAMAERLAKSGYAVLVVNPYYRKAKAPVVPPGSSFQDEATRKVLYPLAGSLSPETTATDAKAFIAYLDQQPAVDTSRKVGTTGYCMGGPMMMRTAAAVPDRVGAGGSFHGGGLVTDGADSPHLLIPKMKARFLIAIAENDDERQPEAKTVLREAFHKAGLKAEVEVYKGTLHGWCPPDSRVYNEAQAEHAWGRLLVTFKQALA